MAREHGSDGAFPKSVDGHNRGLSVREYFAAAALQGMLAHRRGNVQEQASRAVDYADALLAKLAEVPGAPVVALKEVGLPSPESDEEKRQREMIDSDDPDIWPPAQL